MGKAWNADNGRSFRNPVPRIRGKVGGGEMKFRIGNLVRFIAPPKAWPNPIMPEVIFETCGVIVGTLPKGKSCLNTTYIVDYGSQCEYLPEETLFFCKQEV
jgi:hypothetical protein